MTKYRLLLSTALVVVLSGCMGGSAKLGLSSNNSGEPSWYLNSKKSDNQYYYGVGEGSTKAEAKTEALRQIASEISVGISSSMEVNKNTSNGSYSKSVKQNTKATVKQIEFTNVEIIENVQQNNKIYTSLKVSKSRLFQAQKTILDKKFTTLNSIWSTIVDGGTFVLLKKDTTLNKSLKDVASALSILKAIDGNFDDKKYQAKLDSIYSEKIQMISRTGVLVLGDSSTQVYKDLVKEYISNLGLNIIKSKNKVAANDLFIVNISMTARNKKVKTSNPRLRGASFADVKITLTTSNSQNKVIGKSIINVLNISKEGYAHAVTKTQKFEKKIKQEGIVNILFKK